MCIQRTCWRLGSTSTRKLKITPSKMYRKLENERTDDNLYSFIKPIGPYINIDTPGKRYAW